MKNKFNVGDEVKTNSSELKYYVRAIFENKEGYYYTVETERGAFKTIKELKLEPFKKDFPEYIECTESKESYFKKGIIYKVIDSKNLKSSIVVTNVKAVVYDAGTKLWVTLADIKGTYYIPSTKEKYIEQLSPEYIKYIAKTNDYRIKGRIYKVESWRRDSVWVVCNLDCGTFQAGRSLCMDSLFDSPEKYEVVSKKDYEAQAAQELKAGKWYAVASGTEKLYKDGSWFIKFSHIDKDMQVNSSEFLFTDGEYPLFKGGLFGRIGTYTYNEVPLEKIQQYLPDGHVDKKIVFKGDEYYTSFNPDGTVWQIFICKTLDGYSRVFTKDYLNHNVHAYFRNHHTTLALCEATHKVSTSEERQWLDACIKAGKYLTKEEALKPVPKIWDVGTYVVVINPYFRSGTYTKGKIYQIFRNDMLAWIYTDTDEEVNLIDGYITSGGIKWFATLEEAEAFAETIKPKITVESEMERLGLAVGDKIKVVDEPIEDAYYNGYSFEKLNGVRGEVLTINGGIILKNTLFVRINNWSNYVLATAVTKISSGFILGDYEVTVPNSSTVKIGCTELNLDKVIRLLDDFIQISDKFGTNKHDIIFINKVKVNRETADRLLSFISQC